MPSGFLCISQAAGNAAAENARELAATKEKISTLEGAIGDKDKTIAENKTAAAANEADLKSRLHDTEVKLATATGQLIAGEAEKTRMLAVMDILIKNTRKSCKPLSLCF